MYTKYIYIYIALSRKRELFTWATYTLADGMVGPIFEKAV